MPSVLAVARVQLRRRRAVTMLFCVLAGLAAAVPMSVWAAGRQTATSFERFLARANGPDTGVLLCPPGYDAQAEGAPDPCFAYRSGRELEVIRSLPHVEQATHFSFRNVVGGLSDDQSTWRPFGLADLGRGAGSATVGGDPVVVAGRLSARDAADEVMIREPAARALGIEPGARVWLRSTDVADDTPPTIATVTGVVRTPLDLLPAGIEADSGPVLLAREGWVAAHGEEVPGFSTIAVWLDDDDIGAFGQRVRDDLGDQVLGLDPVVPTGERATIKQATDFESRAALATAAVAGVAAIFFVGQAVSRQARSEASHAPTLLALGMTRRELAVVPAVRWAPVALGAAVVATGATLAASMFGPIGVARRGPWERAVEADWLVLVVGAVAVALLVLLAAVAGGTRRGGIRGVDRAAPAAFGRPGMRTGMVLTSRSLGGGALPLGSAVAATSLAIAMVIATAGGAASLRLVTDEPHRYGAPWDALVEINNLDDSRDAAATLSELPGIAAAARIVGTDVRIGDEDTVWTQALLPVRGVEPTRPVMIDGREPVRDDEIAVGSVIRHRAEANVGDVVTVQPPAGGRTLRFRVVGETMVTDGFEPNVGHGAFVTPAALERIDPTADRFPQLAVRLVKGPSRDEALARLRAAFPSRVHVPFPIPLSLANAERISELPVFLAMGGALVAAITFTHALVVSIRRNRQELAVCRVLGFTRRQVYATVATQATLLALAATVLGVLLGYAGARWGWRAIADSFGVATSPVVPLWVVVATIAAVLALANVAAGRPARTAARLRVAEVLRAE